ncbi:MAG: cysteine desulfurase family protein, partial [Chloroflexota bacterium]
PSSVYQPAQATRASLDRSRDALAGCLGAASNEIIFTSGGSEGDNAAIKGAAFARREQGLHLITSAIEHHAVLHSMEELERHFGFEVTMLPVNHAGLIDVAQLEAAIRPNTTLVSIMWANNEIGTIQPIDQIAELTGRRGVTLHVDAVQAAGLLSIDLSSVHVDLLSISAHKFYGPKGVGALYLRNGTPWWPLLTGGGQERNRRAGTENVAGIAAMARALELAVTERATEVPRLSAMRDYLLHEIPARIPGTVINGDAQRRLPNNANFSFGGVHGEALLVALDLAGIMVSSGSACASGSLDPSHVLEAIGVPRHLAQASLRLTLGRQTTQSDLMRTVSALEGIVARLRSLAPSAARA